MPPSHASVPKAEPEIIRDVLGGDFRAVARLISLVENDLLMAVPYLRELFPHTGRCFSVGVTGAPGSGKSTLVDCLAERFGSDSRKVGIIAVDPTSPFSGGAILGDRIRMQSRSLDPGTFIRSMATRGHLGGLSRATNDVLMIMDAAGFDTVLIETVGVGQDEVEIARTADATLVLLVPGMGDDIQAMKAGIMEIGDIFVINKADHAGVGRVEIELNALLAISTRPDGWKPAVVRTVASKGQGIDACIEEITKYRTFLQASPYQRKRSIQIQKDRLLEVIQARILESLLRQSDKKERLEDLARAVAERRIDPFTAADKLLEIKD
ncbi:MAG TPA: methylmalonyl Co-A mutase-associated GTPase MeaB [Acidobacteriota bacterium]|nr:methylmalonyl Co-A mutase-associated GTPase MeaB [Acidobacteriota bacterium]